jgi:D-beta-D-heptose 7-phosphate kinase/D-beta-D-heptose 1-phosphate adenosyltransferase
LTVNAHNTDWRAIVASLAGRRLLVIGDVMLDDYLSGDARRVCPEAPVPVVEVNNRWSVPGGAANAAVNASTLGGKPILGGVTGNDSAAEHLARAIRATGVEPSGLVRDSMRPTTVKLRVLARGQQVIRADTESTAPLPAGPAELLASWAERTVAEVDAVLLSDYGKGVLSNGLATRVIAAARQAGRPIVVDPKGTDAQRYHGATILKPNLSELGELAGHRIHSSSELMNAGQRLADELPGTAVLVTRGAEGMALFRAGCSPRMLAAAHAQRVFDVTGAGDTVAATLTLALGAGHSGELAARIANVAGGIAVSKVGTDVVVPRELLAALAEGVPEFRLLVG